MMSWCADMAPVTEEHNDAIQKSARDGGLLLTHCLKLTMSAEAWVRKHRARPLQAGARRRRRCP
jgi:hypothetical protein